MHDPCHISHSGVVVFVIFPNLSSGLHPASGRVGTGKCPEPAHISDSALSRSEGSVIAYYWSEFSIPSYLVEEAERALAEERAVKLPPRARTLRSFTLTSVVAYRECRASRGGHLTGQPAVGQRDRCKGNHSS